VEGIEDAIRKYEFVFNAEAELGGESTEYREGFIAGCIFVLELETERLNREVNHGTRQGN
jgi:hypothetical protein